MRVLGAVGRGRSSGEGCESGWSEGPKDYGAELTQELKQKPGHPRAWGVTTAVATPGAPRPEAVQPRRGQSGGGEVEALRTCRMKARHEPLIPAGVCGLRLVRRRVQPLNTENRTFGGVGGCRGAIPGTRPD